MTAVEPARTPRTLGELMATVDHTMVRPELTSPEVAAGIDTALELGVAHIVVRPWELPWARRLVPAGRTHVGTSISFPHGDEPTAIKVAAATAAVAAGADEIDVVMNVAAFRSGDREYVVDELRRIVVGGRPAIVKVIIESAYLDDEQVLDAARAAVEAGADFVKNATGYSPRGATPEEVARIRAAVPSRVGVKAAGGIRTLSAALALLSAGASRLGTSSTVGIADEWRRREEGP